MSKASAVRCSVVEIKRKGNEGRVRGKGKGEVGGREGVNWGGGSECSVA